MRLTAIEPTAFMQIGRETGRQNTGTTKMARKPSAKGAKRLQSLRSVILQCTSPLCFGANIILLSGAKSSLSFLKAYYIARHQRGGRRGMSTDEETDLLRGMLVVSAAALDAVVKQLIREALPAVLRHDELAQNAFEKFVARQIRPDAADGSVNVKFLAKLLSRPSAQKSAIEEYVRHLTGGSLQSSASLYDVITALGLIADDVGVDRKTLDPIFAIRNKIIHELDIASAGHRTRNMRSRVDMIKHTDQLLMVAEKILSGIDEKLRTKK